MSGLPVCLYASRINYAVSDRLSIIRSSLVLSSENKNVAMPYVVLFSSSVKPHGRSHTNEVVLLNK